MLPLNALADPLTSFKNMRGASGSSPTGMVSTDEWAGYREHLKLFVRTGLYHADDQSGHSLALISKVRKGALSGPSRYRVELSRFSRGKPSSVAQGSTLAKRRASMIWAQHLTRVFGIDIERPARHAEQPRWRLAW